MGALHPPPGSGNPHLARCCAPRATRTQGRTLTVFSLSARLSRFSGDTCSCCWSVMVASGTRTENMTSESSGRGEGQAQQLEPGAPVTASSAPFKRPAGSARTRAWSTLGPPTSASHWSLLAPPACGRGKFESRPGPSAQKLC